MGEIEIKDLVVFAKHGVLPEENSLGQKFEVSVVFFLDFLKAGKTDSLDSTIDYKKACEMIAEIFGKNTCSLIENAAWKLAEALLISYPFCSKVKVTVKKPWAPVHMPMDTVSVSMERSWKKAYLSIGSNVGDKEANLNEAVRLLNEDGKIQVKKVSDFIITAPVGGVVQDDFLNGALCILTLYEPQELLEKITYIEKRLKREREIHWGPRTIDVDIILYEDLIMNTESLTIPHAEMTRREFVLKPLCQIAPDAVHPLIGKNVWQLYQEYLGIEDDYFWPVSET